MARQGYLTCAVYHTHKKRPDKKRVIINSSLHLFVALFENLPGVLPDLLCLNNQRFRPRQKVVRQSNRFTKLTEIHPT